MNFTMTPVGLDKSKAARLIKEKGLAGMLFTSPENVFYTTGAHTLPGTGNPILFALRNQMPAYSFIDDDGKVTLFVWIGVTMGVNYGVEDVRTFFDFKGAAEELASFLGEKRREGSKIGIESTCPYWASIQVESVMGREKTVLADDIPLRLRLTKSTKELELIKSATQVVERTVSDLGGFLKIGMSRAELAQEARRLMVEHGATGVDHLTVAFGSSNPEVMLDETLEQGRLVTLDLGAVYEGYTSDNRRLFYSGGSPPNETVRLHSQLVGIVDTMGAALKPGTSFPALFSRAVELYEKEGLQPLFFHTGHSIGIQTEEAWISAESDLNVEENMVLNIELYAPDGGGTMIGDEETFVVESTGGRRITVLPREIGSM